MITLTLVGSCEHQRVDEWVGPELARGLRVVTYYIPIAAASELGPYHQIRSLAGPDPAEGWIATSSLLGLAMTTMS